MLDVATQAAEQVVAGQYQAEQGAGTVQNAQQAYDAVAGRATQSGTERQARLSNVSVLKQATAPAQASSPLTGFLDD